MTVDVTCVVPRSAVDSHALRSRHLDHVGLRHPPPDGDRRWRSRRPVSPPWRPSRGLRSIPGCGSPLGWPRFPAAVSAAELLESRERGVEVRLVEYLAAVDQVALDRQNVDHTPLGVEALLRGPMRHVGDDRSEVVQAMYRLDVVAEVRTRGSTRRRVYAGISPGAIDVPRRWSMLTQSGVVAGSSCRLSAA